MTGAFGLRSPAHPREAAIEHPLIKNLEQHDSISEEERSILLDAISQEKRVLKGEDIVQEGDRPSYSVVLLEGFAARYKMDVEGRRQINAVHVPGDFVDLHSFVLEQMDHSVLAVSNCTLAMVPHDAIRKISDKHPHLARLFWTSTAVDGAIVREWLTQLGSQNAVRRTAHLICELFVRLRAVGRTQDHAFDIPLIQAELGDMLGLSLVHVNRTLMSLRKDRLVTWQGGTVTIHDWGRLKDLARFNQTYLNSHNEGR